MNVKYLIRINIFKMNNLIKKLFSDLDASDQKKYNANINKKLIYLKAFLFLLIGMVGFVYCLLLNFSLLFLFLFTLTIWAWCRLYYFMFYVITNYIDPNYKFSSVFDFIIYLFKKK